MAEYIRRNIVVLTRGSWQQNSFTEPRAINRWLGCESKRRLLFWVLPTCMLTPLPYSIFRENGRPSMLQQCMYVSGLIWYKPILRLFLRASNNIIESVGTMAASTLPLRPPSSPLASSGLVQFIIHCLQHIAHPKLLTIMYPGLCIPEEFLEPNMRQTILSNSL